MEKLSRREFLRVSALTTAATVATACVPAAAPTAEPAPPTAVPATSVPPVAVSKFREAPALADIVDAGELPPVDQRLPENPCVAPVVEGIGKYGGVLRRGFNGPSDYWGFRNYNDQGLSSYNLESALIPTLAESWELSEDAKSWRFHLRAGTRWSDGMPFTSGDFAWYWQHHMLNETLTSAPPRTQATGSPRVFPEAEAPDEYTFVVTFADPYPLYAHYGPSVGPAHYLSQYHVDFVDEDTLTTMAKEAGYDTWDQLYLDRMQHWMNPEIPRLDPWLFQNSLSNELIVMERNPYFWRVDAEGQQLPYIDTIQTRLFETRDVFNLWIVNGEIDFQGRHVDWGNYTLFKESEAQGDYAVELAVSAFHSCLTLNQTAKEPRLREFFQDRNVRIAMSHAVNRDEVNELVYDGAATPRQYSPLEQSPNYYPKLSNAYLEYDLDKANALLDEAGYTERDNDGYRVFKDGTGETISFVMECIDPPGTPAEDHALMVVKYLADVGVKCAWKYVERSLHTEHYMSNNLDAAWVRWNNRTVVPTLTPRIFIGHIADHPWGLAWTLWVLDSGDPNGEEPPEGHWIWDIWDIWGQVSTEPDETTRNELFEGILDIWATELPQVGFLGQFPAAIIVKNGLNNHLENYPYETVAYEGALEFDLLYWEEPEKHS